MKKVNILICDDETGVRDSLRLILDREYSLVYATNGAEAVRHLRKHDVDLVIMDVKMPKLSGLDALRQIKRLRPRTRVLIITGYESSDVAAQAINQGADDYLTKPFEREKVHSKILTLLKK